MWYGRRRRDHVQHLNCGCTPCGGAGVRIAKHGNRSFTSRCGSADVLEALGVPLDVPVETMSAALASAGIVFMYAPLMHPCNAPCWSSAERAGDSDSDECRRPLANPAGARRQVVGVADPQRVPILAGALLELDSLHSLVVHGEPGLDEISPLGPTSVVEVRDGQTTEWTIDPEEFGYKGFAPEDLAGGDSGRQRTHHYRFADECSLECRITRGKSGDRHERGGGDLRERESEEVFRCRCSRPASTRERGRARRSRATQTRLRALISSAE
jgi:ribosomal protein S27AE